MPKDVADALKKQGHWKDDYGAKPDYGAKSAMTQGAARAAQSAPQADRAAPQADRTARQPNSGALP
jgi:cytochrome c-type biogenesis protein CcmE